MVKLFACLALMLSSVAAQGQVAASTARDLTVEIFSTAPVAKVTIHTKDAAAQICESTCKALPDANGFVVNVVPGVSGQLQVGSARARELRVVGEARVVTNDDRHASGAGRWSVKAAADGLHVLLTVPTERYVMAVLQSEAGQGDGPEALRALAVVARSFVMTHPHRHSAADVCDSTHCQAARFAPVPQRIRDAVTATAGETLWFGNKQVDGYFTQNCGGHTASASEVWGGTPKSWLRGHVDPFCQREPALWHASVSKDDLLHSLREEGLRAPSTFDSVRVGSRDASGRAKELLFDGRQQRSSVPASAMRFAVNRALGWNRLRSDWYTVHMDGTAVVFDGRGYGHGVGLCQAGAAEMAREGKRYRDILGFYFAGAQVRVNAEDDGWQVVAERGWTLRLLHPSVDAAQAGNAAWEEAQGRWGVPSRDHPTVTLAPDTELFRQLTDQPGWVLAGTRGDDVVLQSAAVIKAHGGYQPILLHEFLHVLVEAEANESAPLWLREGMVEALAGEKRGQNVAEPAAQIESALQHAHTLQEAQAAHKAAAVLVGKLIARYGLGNVRGWLRGGVPAGVLTR